MAHNQFNAAEAAKENMEVFASMINLWRANKISLSDIINIRNKALHKGGLLLDGCEENILKED